MRALILRWFQIRDEEGEYEALPLGSSEDARIGDEVVALGFPLAEEGATSITVTRGIISSRRILSGVEVMHTDAALNPGNSGGSSNQPPGRGDRCKHLKSSGT